MVVLSNLVLLGNGGTPVSLVVSVTTGATVTATNGSKTVSGTSINGTCTLILPEAGTWTVSAMVSGQSYMTQTVTVNDSFSTSFSFASTTLNNNTWSVIKEVSDAGQAANYWAIGDRKAVTLNGTVGACTFSSTTTYAFIIGFNHNSTYEGSNRIHFQFAKTALTGGTDICFIDSNYGSTGSTAAFRMNTSSTNVGGWSSSYMRNTICGTSLTSYSGKFIGVLPSDLRAVLKSVTKYTDNTGNKSTTAASVTATTDYIFLLAEYEIFSAITLGNSNEKDKQARYAYYSAGNSRVKYRHSATSTTAYWFLRSPRASVSTSFTVVTTSGAVNSASAYTSYGFAPGFCV